MEAGQDWTSYLHSCHKAVPLQSAHGVYLTNKHSRSLTVFHALSRLGLLPSQQHKDSQVPVETCTLLTICCSKASKQSTTCPSSAAQELDHLAGHEIRITIAGADRNEGVSSHETARRFSELIRLLATVGVRRLRLLLVGPNIASTAKASTLQLGLLELLALEQPCMPGAQGEGCVCMTALSPTIGSPDPRCMAEDSNQGVRDEEEGWEEGGRSPVSSDGVPPLSCGLGKGWWRGSTSNDSDWDGEEGGEGCWRTTGECLNDPAGGGAIIGPPSSSTAASDTASLGGGPIGLGVFLKRGAARVGAASGEGTSVEPSELLPGQPSAPDGKESNACGTEYFTLRVCYAPTLFHEQECLGALVGAEAADLDSPGRPPHLVACFNAGVWGYGASWLRTCFHATNVLLTPVLFTAYSREEGEDDEDVIEEQGHQFAWKLEDNPFRSMHPWGQGNSYIRKDALDNSEALAENSCWQCLCPPCK